MEDSLTQYLCSLYGSHQRGATGHAFLTKAGEGTLDEDALSAWLVQDKYYQFGYVNFIGRLISKLDLRSYAFPARGGPANLQWKTLEALMGALTAIKAEIDFYNDTVDRYELKLQEDGPNAVTQRYVELFDEASAPDKPMIWGLVVLWATERTYLHAWSSARSYIDKFGGTKHDKGAVAALHRAFIPNWTSSEFRQAVQGLADLADQWVAVEGEKQVVRCEELWLRVLELETEFWPEV